MDTNTLPQRRVLRVEEAAELLGVGRSLAYDLIRDGRLRSFKVGSRRLVPIAAVDELVSTLAGDA
jgi:excisionase family DNA binding protein